MEKPVFRYWSENVIIYDISTICVIYGHFIGVFLLRFGDYTSLSEITEVSQRLLTTGFRRISQECQPNCISYSPNPL